MYGQTILLAVLLSASCSEVRVGRALNIFSSFGDLGSIFKLDHQDFNYNYETQTTDVFEEVFETDSSYPSDPDIFLELCDDLGQLERVLFESYRVQDCEHTWRAYTGGLSSATIARGLGINLSYISEPHSYALVRLTKTHHLVQLAPNRDLQVNNETKARLKLVVPGDSGSVLQFIRTTGSHYISSYTTGDSLFQVFVFTPSVYAEVQEAVQEYLATSEGLDKVFHYFTPLYVEHIGRIISSSDALSDWAARYLQVTLWFFRYPSLLQLYTSSALQRDVESVLGNSVLLSADLRSLALLFTDDSQRLWFQEVLDNHLKLWELNV